MGEAGIESGPGSTLPFVYSARVASGRNFWRSFQNLKVDTSFASKLHFMVSEWSSSHGHDPVHVAETTSAESHRVQDGPETVNQ